MNNADIRQEAKASGVKFCEIAERLFIDSAYLSRLMQKELSDEWKIKIRDAIKSIAKESEEI